MIVYMKLL